MLRRLATIAVVTAVLGSSMLADAKWGGIARQIAMGGSNAGVNLILNPYIMDDPALMLLNPAYQANYRNYVWMNIGGGTPFSPTFGSTLLDEGYGHQNAGVAFGFGKEWSAGVIASYDPSAAGAVGSLIGLMSQRVGGSTQSIPSIGNVWEAVGTFSMSGFDVGLGVMYGNSNNDSTSSVTPTGGTALTYDGEASSSVIGFRGGINVDIGGGSSVDASAALRMDKATDKITVSPAPALGIDGEYSATGTELVFAARAKMKVSNRVNFVPFGVFAMVSAEAKEDVRPTTVTTTPPSTEVSANAFAVGAGGEYRVPDFYLAGGLSFQSAAAELKQSQVDPTGTTSSTTTLTYMAVPVVNLGGEWWFTDWLAGRGGYYRSLGSLKREYTTSSPAGSGTAEANTTVPNSFILVGGINPGNFDGLVTLGIGLKFGNFSLDATVSEQALRRGFGLIGASDNINTFGFMNASYNLD